VQHLQEGLLLLTRDVPVVLAITERSQLSSGQAHCQLVFVNVVFLGLLSLVVDVFAQTLIFSRVFPDTHEALRTLSFNWFVL
jgi:hypothetical protein